MDGLGISIPDFLIAPPDWWRPALIVLIGASGLLSAGLHRKDFHVWFQPQCITADEKLSENGEMELTHLLDTLNEVADERLTLGDRPVLQEVPEIRHVPGAPLGLRQIHSPLL